MVARSRGADVRIVANAEQVARKSQLVVTTIPAREPVLIAELLHPGLHIACMGSDQQGKNEINPAALNTADLYVCDRVSQCEALGELRSAREAGYLTDTTPPELGHVITGVAEGWTSETDMTICDLTGTGAQDTAIANYALDQLRVAGAGTWFQR